MPWKAFLQNKEYCVFKLNEAGDKTGSSLGCHPTKVAANRQIAALNASEMDRQIKEGDEMPEDEVKEELETKAHIGGMEAAIPMGITSFTDLDAALEAQEMVNTMKLDTAAFAEMAENIFYNSEIEDKANALQSLAGEFTKRVASETKEEKKELDEEGLINRVVSKAKEMIGIKDKPKSDGGFYVWKEADGYHWMSVYSNNIKDNDKPPDIISAKSHQRFVEMVDKGETSLPELWLWHVPEWKWGEATGVAYDDKGFAVAIGKVDDNPAAISVADFLKERDDILTSHGMPPHTVKREQDEKGNNVIVEHITREISPLFDFAAANKYTGFSILKEVDMIPEHKKEEFIKQGLAADVLDELEKRNAVTDKETETLEKKEEEVATPQEAEAVQEQPLTREEVVGAFTNLAQVITPLVEQMKELSAEVKELKEERVSNIPRASLDAVVDNLFNKDTQVDGRSSLAKSKPKETETQPEGSEFFINQFLGGGRPSILDREVS
jgi:hypothetical protein